MSIEEPPFIRRMQTKDINIMAEIARDSMPHPWSRAIFNSCFKEDYYGCVLTHGDLANQVMGFVIVLIQLQEGQILNLCVRKSVQHCGYGRDLLLHVTSISKQRQVKKIWLETRCSNHVAMQCYRSVGFEKVAIRPGYYPLENGTEDAFVFKLLL